MPGPGVQNRRAGGRKQKQENRGPEGGPGPQGSSGLVPRWGEGGGRDGSVGRPDGRRAPSVGLTNGAVGAVGVGCTVAWAAKVHALSLVLRGFGYKIAPAARCFCFLNRGPGPSDGAGGGALTERSKTLRPGVHGLRVGTLLTGKLNFRTTTTPRTRRNGSSRGEVQAEARRCSRRVRQKDVVKPTRPVTSSTGRHQPPQVFVACKYAASARA